MSQSPSEKRTFKIFRLPEWTAFQETGTFEGSPDDLRDGFIHLSGADQVAGVLERYFAGEAEIVLAEIACAPARGDLKWEVSTGGAAYPHFYGRLGTGDVVRSEPLVKRGGAFSLPAWAA